MKRNIAMLFASVFIFSGLFGYNVLAQRPDYEKYGRIATVVIKEDYPGEAVQDYQYMGRKQLSDGQVMDSFQYKVSVNGKPVLATVQISHDLKNNRLLSLTVTEQPQQ